MIFRRSAVFELKRALDDPLVSPVPLVSPFSLLNSIEPHQRQPERRPIGEAPVIDQDLGIVPGADEVEELEEVVDLGGGEDGRMAEPFSAPFLRIGRASPGDLQGPLVFRDGLTPKTTVTRNTGAWGEGWRISASFSSEARPDMAQVYRNARRFSRSRGSSGPGLTPRSGRCSRSPRRPSSGWPRWSFQRLRSRIGARP